MDTVYFDKCYSIKYNSNNKDSNTIMEIYLCWFSLVETYFVQEKLAYSVTSRQTQKV
jgi:hypothetical protein